MPDGVHEGRGIRLERLHDHASGRVAPAAAGQLRDELERPLLRAEVGEREAGVGVDDRSDLDTGEVMALRDHLRPDQHGGASGREPLERLAQRAGPRRRVGVEPDPLEAGHPPRELGVEALRAGPDARELDRSALRARLRQLAGEPAVVAVQAAVVVQGQRDVAAPAAPRHAARAAVDRPRHAATVEEENRASAALTHGCQLGQERRRERIAGLAPQVDELDGRHRRADPCRQRQPVEARPALGARCRAAVHGDGALERRPLRRNRPRVVPRIRLLLERGVVLLVDDDEPEAVDRREDRGTRPDHDRRAAGRDALALVAPLGVGQRRVQHRHAVAETRAEPSDRLRRQGDLGHEDDDSAFAFERRRGRLQVHLGLPASGRPVQQHVATAAVECTVRPAPPPRAEPA